MKKTCKWPLWGADEKPTFEYCDKPCKGTYCDEHKEASCDHDAEARIRARRANEPYKNNGQIKERKAVSGPGSRGRQRHVI